jgi:hypothetical protein
VLWRKRLKIGPGNGAGIVVAEATLRNSARESRVQGEGQQIFRWSAIREEHTVQKPNALLTILSKMGQKPAVKFDKLFPKLYNIELWLLAYERLAPQPGNMTPGTDGKTIDGTGLTRIQAVIAELKASRYKPKPVRRVYIPKSNGQQRPIGIPSFEDKLLQMVVHLILTAIYEPTVSRQILWDKSSLKIKGTFLSLLDDM